MAVFRPKLKNRRVNRFYVAGRETKISSGTSDRRLALELEKRLKEEAYRSIKLGERTWLWDDAVGRFRDENRSLGGSVRKAASKFSVSVSRVSPFAVSTMRRF